MTWRIRRAMREFIHRHIWRRLPRGLRRAGLHYATLALAPRPTSSAGLQPPYFVCGPLTMATGIGEGARLCHDALLACGLDARGVDLPLSHLDANGPVSHPFKDGRGHEGPGTVIIHVNAPHMALALMKLGTRFIHGKHIVGAWAWELPVAPDSWKTGFDFVHEVWASSVFTAEALRPLAGHVPVKAVGYPAALHRTHPLPHQPERNGTFRVLTMFDMSSSFTRKNGLGAVAAFRGAFGTDTGAELVIKTARTSHFPQGLQALQEAATGLNLRLIDGDLSSDEISALYAQADVILSLHRAEGFGLLAAEGMLHGKPVIATDFSATREFLDATTGFPVPWVPVAATDPQGVYGVPGAVWADPDIAAAAAVLVQLKHDPALRQRIGDAAARRARERFSATAYCHSAGLIAAAGAPAPP
jgi:Glycosyl transferases group 1